MWVGERVRSDQVKREFLLFSFNFLPQGQTVFTWSDGTLTADERYDGRTSIVERPELRDNTVVAINVSSLRESDTGVYECRVTYREADPSFVSPQPSFAPSLTSTSTAATWIAVTTHDGAADGVRFRLDVRGEFNRKKNICI